MGFPELPLLFIQLQTDVMIRCFLRTIFKNQVSFLYAYLMHNFIIFLPNYSLVYTRAISYICRTWDKRIIRSPHLTCLLKIRK